MGAVNSYLSIAENDYLYAKNGLDFCRTIDNYNNVVSGCAQAAEKYLKAILELYYADEVDSDIKKLLSSHNLRSILNKLKEKCDITVSTRDCKWLGDFYFDTRYPGDNFTVTHEDDALEALQILEQIRENAIRLVTEENARREEARKAMEQWKAFRDINNDNE